MKIGIFFPLYHNNLIENSHLFVKLVFSLSVSTSWAAKSSRFSTRLQFPVFILYYYSIYFITLTFCLNFNVGSYGACVAERQTKPKLTRQVEWQRYKKNWYQRPAISLQLLLSHIITIHFSVVVYVAFSFCWGKLKKWKQQREDQRTGWNEWKIKQ